MEVQTQSFDLKVTERAAKKIAQLIKEEGGSERMALRIYITGGGCSGYRYGMALDENVYDDDVVVEANGVRVVIDSFSAPFIEGSEIDYVEDVMGSGFAINNPNVTSTCGCGHSFSLK
ncbi:MAG: iron-sulfur cluster insertion protein ErpA [Candidatus Caldarchaeum sp.]|nr:iron-sulfur cluster insertion protein ErpA [Candidatus Caldarchaeum sp.]